MSFQQEMNAYGEQINLQLFNDILGFVLDTSEVPGTKKTELCQSCILVIYTKEKNAFQERYGFLYLGEMLERYEERFGLCDADLRAIALALGFLKDILTDDMFVGKQRVNFLQLLRRRAGGDLYLTCALCLLSEGQAAAAQFQQLCERGYERTEELIFVLSIAPDFEAAFDRLKPQLLHLLGTGRTMPVLGNIWILNWLLTKLQPLLKMNRAKDMALFRTLCALPASFVKPGSKYYDFLLKSGYSQLEIIYANMLTVQYQTFPGALRQKSIVTEKIAVELFLTVLGSSEALPEVSYQQLSAVYKRYKTFEIKCYGEQKLLNAIFECAPIQNASTFVWFSTIAPAEYPAFQLFDVLDAKWDSLAVNMPGARYLDAFEKHLSDTMSAEEIRLRIARYELLSGKDYLSEYWINNCGGRFHLLVKKGVIDLWNAFQESLSSDGVIIRSGMLYRIESYVRGLPTVEAYQFCERFLSKYGFDGWRTYFGNLDRLIDSLIQRSYRGNGNTATIRLNLKQGHLDNEMRRSVIYWLGEYFFTEEPQQYLPFIVGILADSDNEALFSADELKALFELVIGDSDLTGNASFDLKKRFWTPEEQEAEHEKKLAAEREKKEQAQRAFEARVLSEYRAASDGSIQSIMDTLDNQAKYRRDVAKVLYPAALVDARKYLAKTGCLLDCNSAKALLNLLSTLVNASVLSFSEAQEMIIMVKEVLLNECDTIEAAC